MIPTPAGDRVITGTQLRATRTWIDGARPHLSGFGCADRVAAVVGCLIEDPRTGWFSAYDLQAALRDVDTIDCALDLLAAAGLGCT